MKKIVLALSVLFVLSIAAPSFAYNVSGTWTYNARIDSQIVSIDSVSYDFKAEESGTVVMNTTTSDGVEYFSNHVSTITGTASKKMTGSSVWDSAGYTFGPQTVQDAPYKYVYGNTYTFTNNTATIWGLPVAVSYDLTQTGENTITGTISMKYNDQVVKGTLLATRPAAPVDDGTSSGMCNAFGMSGLLLFAVVPLMCKRKREKKAN